MQMDLRKTLAKGPSWTELKSRGNQPEGRNPKLCLNEEDGNSTRAKVEKSIAIVKKAPPVEGSHSFGEKDLAVLV